jgi:hypothetical protein
MRATSDRIDEVEFTLMQQGMPSDEIRAVLRADDPLIVHRYLELHRERLAERLEADRSAVDLVERALVGEGNARRPLVRPRRS